MNERVSNTHSKGERVKIPLLPKQSKIKGAGQRQWSRQGGGSNDQIALVSFVLVRWVMASEAASDQV